MDSRRLPGAVISGPGCIHRRRSEGGEAPIVNRDDSPAVSRDDPTAVSRDDPTAVNRDDPTAVSRDDPTAVNRDDPTAVNRDDPTAVSRDIPWQRAGMISQQCARTIPRQWIRPTATTNTPPRDGSILLFGPGCNFTHKFTMIFTAIKTTIGPGLCLIKIPGLNFREPSVFSSTTSGKSRMLIG